MKVLLELFYVFFKIGLLTVGGGYAMLPMLERETVENRKWITNEEMLDYYSVGQSTPGIIAINTATFVGYKKKGIWGAIFATLGMVTPSLIIIMLIAHYFDNFYKYEIVKKAFSGIRIGVIVLILSAAIRMGKKAIKDNVGVIFTILSFVIISFLNISPIIVIVVSAFIGIMFKLIWKGDGQN